MGTLEGHSDWVRSVAFSHDLTRLASGSSDSTAKIWDANSGTCLQTVEGHGSSVSSVAFSYNSSRLASGSGDMTVKIWNVSSGACLKTVKGHSSEVYSVVFSHHSARLASASRDSTVKIWDVSSGACLQALDMGRPLYNGSYIFTEIGVIVITTSAISSNTAAVTEPHQPQYQHLGISPDNTWITYNSKKLVWLPSEYRPDRSTVSGKMIGIGVGSGRVWLCNVGRSQGGYR